MLAYSTEFDWRYLPRPNLICNKIRKDGPLSEIFEGQTEALIAHPERKLIQFTLGAIQYDHPTEFSAGTLQPATEFVTRHAT